MSDPLTSSALGSSTQGPFRLERHGPLAELVLSRPARHNAFDADLMLGLLDCLDDLAHLHGHDLAERPHALLLRAEGKHFARAPISTGCAIWLTPISNTIAKTPGYWRG